MSNKEQIRAAYLEDKKDPFDSVTGGRRRGKLIKNNQAKEERPRTASQILWIYGQTDPNWKWGHFAAALAKALPKKKRSNFNPYRACRQLERMLPGAQVQGFGL